MDIEAAFSDSYAQARQKFLAAAAQAGLTVQSHIHPLRGKDGEELAMDVVRDGPADAQQLLIVTSACHGVEGYCGSGVQIHALGDAAWREYARQHGVAVLYIHALNPYGFSHLRRVTHENVDLNRNFHGFDGPLPVNAGYRQVQPLLLPQTWPPGEDNAQAVQDFIAREGEAAWQAAISAGQYEFPDGLFFGGHAPTWSNQTLRGVLREHGTRAQRIAWIDLHTGLGPNGYGERIYAGKADPRAEAMAKAWWSSDGDTPVTSIYDGSSSSALLTGLMWTSIYDECPQAEYTGIALEYGTVPVLDVMHALRAEQWLHLHPEAPAEQAAQIKQQMLHTFYTDTPQWREQIVVQARQAMFQGVDGLRGAPGSVEHPGMSQSLWKK